MLLAQAGAGSPANPVAVEEYETLCAGSAAPSNPFQVGGAAPMGGTVIAAALPGDIAGWDTAMNALNNPECDQAIGAGNVEVAQAALANTPIYNTSSPGTTGSALNPGATPGYYNPDSGAIYLNQIFYDPTGNVGGPFTAISLLQLNLPAIADVNITAATYQALVLVHELGHVLGGLPSDAGDGEQSLANTMTIINSCFSYLFNQ
jgi:hypothetical protein